MDVFDIELVQIALFGVEHMKNKRTGGVRRYYASAGPQQSETFELKPKLSMAHVRQKFLMEKWPAAEIEEQEIAAFPQFPLTCQAEGLEQENAYISKAHCFCEDHQLEEAFWDFYHEYTLLITIKWCEENGVAFTL